MGFLSTFYLWLLPLSTLPLLIHLFFNRKYKVVEFSSVKLLKVLKIDSIRKVKIIEILLLLIRTLIIIFIILMLSKPVIKSNAFSSVASDDPIFCIIAIDDSFSATRSNEDISINSHYLADINKLIDTLPGNSELRIVSISDTSTLYMGMADKYTSAKIPGMMKYSSADYSFLNKYINKYNDRYNKEIHILSDLESSSFPKEVKNISDDWNVIIHDKIDLSDNIAILSAKVLNEIPSLNKEIQIEVTVQNTGSYFAKNALLILSINSINVGQFEFDLAESEISSHIFKTIISSPGDYECNFEIVYDNIRGDNYFHFPININSEINIGILSEISKDYYFLENTLKAISSANPNVSYKTSNMLLSDQNSIVENDINFIYGYNYIENNNIESTIIDNFTNGGHIYIFPSSNENKEIDKNDFWDFLDIDSREVELIDYEGSSFFQITKQNIFNKSIETIFANKQVDDLFRLYKHFSYNTYKNPLILVNGKSVWEQVLNGKGAVNLIGFNFDLDWTNLPLKASFISFTDALINMNRKDDNKIYETGDKLPSTIPFIKITTPDKKEYKGTKDSDIYRFQAPGIYQIEGQGSSHKIYVNPPLSELTHIDVDTQTLDSYYSNYSIITDMQEIDEVLKEARVGKELWKIFLYLAIILIIIEMVISNQFFRRT